MIEHITEAKNCLALAKTMRILHHDAVTNEWYMKELYPLLVAVYNMGGLCLMSEPFFAFGQLLLKYIPSQLTIRQLKSGDQNAVSSLYDKLVADIHLHNLFMQCAAEVSSQHNDLSGNSKKMILKYLIQKTFHACTGVVTTLFAEDTTGWYCATAKTDPLRSELKIKSRSTSIAKAK